jgi:hypothetical protein
MIVLAAKRRDGQGKGTAFAKAEGIMQAIKKEGRMLKSRTLKLAVAAFTIMSAMGLTGAGAQALAATAVPHSAA